MKIGHILKLKQYSSDDNQFNSIVYVHKKLTLIYSQLLVSQTLISQSTLLHKKIQFGAIQKLLISQIKFSGTRKFILRYQKFEECPGFQISSVDCINIIHTFIVYTIYLGLYIYSMFLRRFFFLKVYIFCDSQLASLVD